MDRLISCEFNMDTACVELKFLDGSMIAIDTIAVENEVADNMYQQSELGYLIYNDPIGYTLYVKPYSISSYYISLYCFFLQRSLFHFFFIRSFGISDIAFCPEHFILCQLLHSLRKISLQSATLHIAVYGIQSLLINLFQRVIVRKFPLFSAFQVTDLPTGAVQLIPRCIATAVFGVPCVGGEKPFAADFAFLRCMTNTYAEPVS